MAARLSYDRVLGREVNDKETCSKCGATIPDDHVPLMLFGDKRMWVYCAKHEGEVLDKLAIVNRGARR